MSDAGSKATVDFEKMSGLDVKLRELQAEQESLEEQWLSAAEVLGSSGAIGRPARFLRGFGKFLCRRFQNS